MIVRGPRSNDPSPAAVIDAIRRTCKEAEPKSRHRYQELQNQYYFHRFLARVAAHDPTGWCLKGGQALLVRYVHGRASKDIDLYSVRDGNLEEAVAALRVAAEVDLQDLFTFQYVNREDSSDHSAHGTKLFFNSLIGADVKLKFSVDVVVGLQPTQSPEPREIVPEINIDWPGLPNRSFCRSTR